MTVRKYLLKIKNNGPGNQFSGICCNIKNTGFVADMSHLWPRFSGLESYPVPSCTDASPIRAYYDAQDTETMWDRDHPYGQARWELVDFLIDVADRQIVLLQQLKNIDPEKADPLIGGICPRLDCYSRSMFRFIAKMWPKYSGYETYPVPHPELPAAEAYYQIRDIWDPETTYVKNRRELLAWSIQYLEQHHGHTA